MVAIIIKDIDIDHDYEGLHPAYYIDDDKDHKIVFLKDGDKPVGLYRADEPVYPYVFNMDVVCINGLNLNDINKDNYNNYEFKIIRFCVFCNKSADLNYSNLNGFCNCNCSCCNDKLIDCNCIPEGYGDCFCNE